VNHDARLVLALIVLAVIIAALLGFLGWLLWGALCRGFDFAMERYIRWRNHRRRAEYRVGRPYRSSHL
jgi:hypothetical protein